mgnify:CR=1 FL=1
MAKILLVEDEINIASFIERGLQEFGHEVRVANDGQAGWELVQQEDFHLLILDIIMPKMNGLQLCKQYRQTYGYQSPVIMLTALGTTDDIVNGLDAGADDYLTKPFAFSELSARLEALVRRAQIPAPTREMQVADLRVNLISRSAERAGQPLSLQPREFRLLAFLMQHAHQIVTRTMLLESVWDYRFDPQTNVIDVHISRLRSKVDKGFATPLIHTVRGVGYSLSDQPQDLPEVV